MGLFHQLRRKLQQAGLFPMSKLALGAWYLLALDIFLFLLQKLFAIRHLSYGDNLTAWVIGLSLAVIASFAVLALRWVKTKMMWRLRNRLIITYVFIGVIPVILLVVLSLGSFYLFAGQFATFIVTTKLQSEIKALDAANSAIARELASRFESEADPASTMKSLRKTGQVWANRQVSAWLDEKLVFSATPAASLATLPARWHGSFRGVVRDHDRLFLRAAEKVSIKNHSLTVVSNEPLDEHLLQNLAENLGEVTLYASGFLQAEEPSSSSPAPQNVTATPRPTARAGSEPAPVHRFDSSVTFPAAISVVDWETGGNANPAAIGVQTRLSKLYQRLFESLGDFAPAVEFTLLLVAIVFAVIELAALLIGVRLTRTVTAAVDQLYGATHHVNRGEFNYRIPVRSQDQLATLADSFNGMAASLEKLMAEQKEKQRMENELAIAQEVQEQLFPRHISQLSTLEVFGFCRPARTVSGDYYDFLALSADKLLLAVGDVSGKGISAALLMATIHSAVRAYSLEGIPILRESAVLSIARDSPVMAESLLQGAEVSPGAMLNLLNHQLYESTPAEKYATLFLGFYDGQERKLTYSNAGHLPPVIFRVDESIHKLHHGGTVIGLLDQQGYEESSVQLQPGEVFLAYSDGVTEPENDFGEFGEDRLMNLVQNNRHLPLSRICEIVTSAVSDWIGPYEQPDDVTLVLARAR